MLKPGTRFGLALQLEVLSSNKDSGLILYKVFCHTCAKDKELFGDGIFTTTKDRLEKFQFPCGCGSCRKWTKKQYRVKIEREIEKRYCSFVDFTDEKVRCSTKLKLKCLVCDNVWSSCTIQNFLNPLQLNDCPNCASSGYKKELPAVFYILKIESPENSFTGYGITNYFEKRLSRHKSNLAKVGYRITDKVCLEMSGHRAMAVEQMVPYSFPTFQQAIPGFKKEATDFALFSNLVKFATYNSQQEH